MPGSIAFVEGLPGVGKSTIIDSLARHYRSQGLSVRVIDIDSDPLAALLEASKELMNIPRESRILIRWALRIQQHQLVAEAATADDLVISDRSWATAIANDVYGNDISREVLDRVSGKLELQEAEIGIVLFLDAPLETAMLRKPSSKTYQDRWFAARVAGGYRALSQELGWNRIDATLSESRVLEECIRIVDTVLDLDRRLEGAA